jgi:hypothetical protein
MDIHALIARCSGEYLSNKVFIQHEGQRVKVGRFENTELVFTEEGKAIADKLSHVPAESQKAVSKSANARVPRPRPTVGLSK